MKNHKDNVGKTIRGIFKILDYQIRNKKPYYFVECLLCNDQKWIRCDSIFNEKVISCGCYNKSHNYLKPIDIKGMRSGRLVAVCDLGTIDGLDHVWECECDCGNKHNVPAYLIKAKRINSCGCLQDNARKENAKKALESCKDFIKNGTNYKSINATKPLSSNKSSGERCITYDKARNKWVVVIGYKGKSYHLGRHDDIEDAIKIRDMAFEARKKDSLSDFHEKNKTN